MVANIIYAFGWRPSLPDIRDDVFAFRPRREVLAALPPLVDLDNPSPGTPYNPPFNQGSLGSCGPQSAAGDILHALLTRQNVPSPPTPSRLFIYYNARMIMGTVNQDSGVDNRSLMKAMAQYGWCDEELWPYLPDQFTRKPPQNCYDQAATRKIIEYNNVAQDLNTMKACLAGGDPFIFGFSVYNSMMTSQVEETGDIPMPGARDRQQGGHDVVIVGYDDAVGKFKIRNSWGMWGRKGYGTVPYAYATHPRLSSDFWTVKASPWPTQPGPTPEPGTGLAPVLEAQDADGKPLGKYTLSD